VFAGDEPSPRAVYEQVLRSSAWVRLSNGWGTGALIDRERKLVLTSCHVVKAVPTVKVYFPAYDRGRIIADRTHYEKTITALPGRIVYKDPVRDLALVELDSLPEGVVEIKLAASSAAPGERVHSVGNGKTNGVLWAYHSGVVRQVQRRVDAYSGVKIDCTVLETQAPHNPGDSGGPTVNARGELVGITAAYVTTAQLLSFHIDITEVQAFLEKARQELRKQ
jgi:S1-C subfamily serine protease